MRVRNVMLLKNKHVTEASAKKLKYETGEKERE